MSTDNHQFRPALLTQMIKNTRYPHKLLTLWIRDREKCPIDHINASAAIVHLSQLCLQKVQPDQIYDKCMSWSVIRLIRDLFKFIDQYDMRHIANIMWSLGVITSNMSDGGSIHFVPKSGSGNSNIKIHRDFRRLAAKLLIRFENDIEIKRKCNVQNMVDMLWAMNCVGLKVHHFFYQFCIDLYCKLDIDIGVTPDALAYLGVLYATRLKLKEKIKIKPKKKQSQVDMIDSDDLTSSSSEDVELEQLQSQTSLYNDDIPKKFWMKLLKEFSDDFLLIEAEPHHVANIIWTYGRIGNKYLSANCDPMEEQWIIEQFNKLLTFIQDRLDQCDGQTLSILLWAVSCSNYKSLQICRKHPIFDGNNSKSIGSRILQLIETDDCYIIPNLTNPSDDGNVSGNLYSQRYGQSKAYTVSLYDFIVIFESITNYNINSDKMDFVLPEYVLILIINRMKEQLKYGILSMRELISLIESVDELKIGDEIFYAIMGRKLVKVIKERPVAQWNYSEFLGLLGVINNHDVLYKNLDLVFGILSKVRLGKQAWGQLDGKPIQLLGERMEILEERLKENELIFDVKSELKSVSGDNDGVDDEENAKNLSVLIADLRQRVSKKLQAK